MQNIKKLHVTIEEAPGIAEELNSRIAEFGIPYAVLSKAANISKEALEKILSGETAYKRHILKKLTKTIEDIITNRQVKQEKQKIHENNRCLGAKIKARRIELELSLEKVGGHVGVTRSRIQQIEEGQFSPDLPTIKRVLEALGYL